jgi:hypothetical protein
MIVSDESGLNFASETPPGRPAPTGRQETAASRLSKRAPPEETRRTAGLEGEIVIPPEDPAGNPTLAADQVSPPVTVL